MSIVTDEQNLQQACKIACNDLISELSDGHWTGELSSSALSTATAISALSLYFEKAEPSDIQPWMREQLEAAVPWLVSQQNEDGGWGDTDRSRSNISTTMLSIAAIRLFQKTAEASADFADLLARAEKFVDVHGGIAGLKARYGKDKTFAVPILANCAMAGIVPWKQVAALPFELACVPQALYRFVRMPVVSYAVPALVGIGQAKYFADKPRNPITRVLRRLLVGRSLKVLKRMQPESGGYLEAIPLTCFVAMSLIHRDRPDHAVVKQALEFVRTSFRSEGSWPIDTNLATWVTTLSVIALENHTTASEIYDAVDLDWLLGCQYEDVHPFTGAQPGGWGWSNLSGAVPDADDTPGALLAINVLLHKKNCSEDQKKSIVRAAQNGVEWLLDLQNRDHGWPTFCRGWGRLPFDRSGVDITAHVLRSLYVWRDQFESRRLNTAIQTGIGYIEKNQNADGSWFPLWFGNQDHADEENPVYGTAKVLRALIELKSELGQNGTSALQRGFIWLVDHQNSDGGWGGGSACNDLYNSQSSVEETALAIEVLALACQQVPEMIDQVRDRDIGACVDLGKKWMVSAICEGKHHVASPIGFYFAKLWYYEKLYPKIFSTAALTQLGAIENLGHTIQPGLNEPDGPFNS